MMGGGDFVVPVQTVTDFLDNRLLSANLFLSLALHYCSLRLISTSFLLQQHLYHHPVIDWG